MARDPKKLPDGPIDGSAGVGLIKLIVGLMHHVLYEYGQPEVGIDGAIELRDPATHAMTGRFLFVQSKAHAGEFDNETEDSFTYTLKPRDLDYWTEASGPVLLIVSRPGSNEAYWLSVKDFFADPGRRESHRAEFDKKVDAFTKSSSPDLFNVFRRDEARRAFVSQSLVQGPFLALGLHKDLAEAEAAEQRGDHVAAGIAWLELAGKVESRLPRPFIWPLLERAASASKASGQRERAIDIYKRLARERLAEDDPSAHLDVHRALWAGASETDFDLVLLSVRADTAERGVEILDSLRALHRQAKSAKQRRALAEALVDALVLFGYWDEAVRVADSVALKRLDSNEKRCLLMDRCDAAGELGIDVEGDWARVIESAEDAGPQPVGQALQRRAVYLARHGDVAGAQGLFRDAADVWALKVDGAVDQAAEALFSAEEAVRLNGQKAEELPYGTRSVAAFTRGAAQVAAVRGDRLALSGLAQLADKQYAEAIKHLTLGLMVERRAGDLFGLSRMLVFLGRAYEAVDEPAEALRWWVRAGDTLRIESTAGEVEFAQGVPLLRLTGGAAWEQAASFAALAVWASKLSKEEVAEVAAVTVAAAESMPTGIAPQPSFYARKALCSMADRVPARLAPAVDRIFREEIETGGFSERDAAGGLVELTQRGLTDAIPFLLGEVLAGRELPVSVAGYLKDGPTKLHRRVVKAALSGNLVALSEAARADLPERYPELKALCGKRVRAALPVADEGDQREYIGMSFYDLGDVGRHSPRPTQRRLVNTLVKTVLSERFDDMSKTSALITLAELARGLERTPADRALKSLLPIARGDPVHSAPAALHDHRNPKRSRNSMTRTVGGAGLRGVAIQACGRLACVADPSSPEVAAMIDSALSSGTYEFVRMALRELLLLPGLEIDHDPTTFVEHEDPKVRAAAEALLERQRTGEVPAGYK